MVKVKPRALREAAYKRAIPGVSASYKTGIESTQDWQSAALAGQGLYVARMQDSSVLDRRAKKLARVSNQDWKGAALSKGVGRIAGGMEAGAGKQSQNYQPYADGLESVSLPDRTADPMTNIDNRVKPIVQKMVEIKEQIG